MSFPLPDELKALVETSGLTIDCVFWHASSRHGYHWTFDFVKASTGQVCRGHGLTRKEAIENGIANAKKLPDPKTITWTPPAPASGKQKTFVNITLEDLNL